MLDIGADEAAQLQTPMPRRQKTHEQGAQRVQPPSGNKKEQCQGRSHHDPTDDQPSGKKRRLGIRREQIVMPRRDQQREHQNDAQADNAVQNHGRKSHRCLVSRDPRHINHTRQIIPDRPRQERGKELADESNARKIPPAQRQSHRADKQLPTKSGNQDRADIEQNSKNQKRNRRLRQSSHQDLNVHLANQQPQN